MNPLPRPRQLIIDLPDLKDSDLIDMIRVLQSMTDALLAQHQAELRWQQHHEQQLELFQVDDFEPIPF